MVADPEVSSLVFAAADLSPEDAVLVVEPGVVLVPVVSVAEPEVVSAAVVFVAGPEIVFVAPFATVHVSGPQGSVHIHTVFAVAIPVSAVV